MRQKINKNEGQKFMLLRWDDFKYLLALEQTGNLVNAAKFLKTNPTTVSRKIKRLSETYQRTLVSRTSSGEWELTEQGRAFATAARLCQNEISRLGGPAEANDKQDITVSTVDFVAETFLAPKIGELPLHRKKISLTLEATDRNVSLAYGEADLAIRLGRPKQGRLVVSRIGTIDMGVYASERNFGNAWVGLPACFDWVPEMQAGFEFFGEAPAIRMSTFHCIRSAAVERGLPCVGPASMLENWNGLKKIDKDRPQPFREVWSVHHEDRRHDELLLQVKDWARACFVSKMETVAA
ncbi:LysR family transcriptional regulator [Tateyamaria sp. Alg231-49]|uniref:LysR family transcriptional regulator n=1 Tax=Tateyamaria sp. Alg231-49 TaxID=1922219 RepID=UPI000D54CC4F|nr:LysR family transcriptional regulator [Tateyamaria sp. Alg231-49]